MFHTSVGVSQEVNAERFK